MKHTGDWYIQAVGRYTMASVPSNLGALIPASAALDPAQWNLAGLSAITLRFDQNYSYSGWENIIDSPRPTYAVWFGDTWRISNQLTINYGIRYDADPNMAAAPNVKENSILIDAGLTSDLGEYRSGAADYGYKRNIHDWKNIAPRAGFTYNIGGRNDFVIRGGSGLYYASPVSNVTFSPGVYSNLITATFANDGRADFITNPTNGVPGSAFLSGAAPVPAQSPRVIVEDFRAPFTWQSSIGFQKQLNSSMGIEVDLTHYDEYNDTRSIDANLRYNPATGYNAPVSAGRPNRSYGQLLAFTSDGHKDQTQIATALTRRLRAGFQAGVTYTLMLAMHDDGTLGYVSPSANNPFDYLDGEYATSTDFQRNTVRMWALYQLPWGFSTSVSYFYGSGNRFNATISGTPCGKTGSNRLNLSNTGGPANTIVIPADMRDRWDGPDEITSGTVIPRNALRGLPLHKVDIRVTKEIRLVGTAKAQLIGEVFNLFNRANYGSYNTALSATSAAQTALFGRPAQNTGTRTCPGRRSSGSAWRSNRHSGGGGDNLAAGVDATSSTFGFATADETATGRELTYIAAISEALGDEMRRDPRVLLLGEDIAGDFGGAFKVTKGFEAEFGAQRCLNTPICELGFTAMATGMALMGLRPVIEMQFADFISSAFDSIVQFAANAHYRHLGAVPWVIRAPSDGGLRSGPFHSQNPEAWFAHTPGLKVVAPGTPADAKGLLIAAIRDNNPVIYFESKPLYRTMKGHVPSGEYVVPLGQANVVRQGDALSIITYGAQVREALTAAERLSAEKIECEVLDLRTLKPLDTEAILASVRRTNKVLIVHAANRFVGVGAEVSALIAQEAFDALDGPIVRLGGLDTPVPFSPPLEDAYRPNGQKIYDAAKSLARY